MAFLNIPAPSLVCRLIGAAALLLLAAAVLATDAPLWFDEVNYLAMVELLSRYGMSRQFLLEYEYPAGPLYTIVHFIFRPLTGLQPPAVRLVNIFFICWAVFFLEFVLRRLAGGKTGSALYLLSAPVLYVSLGTALNEPPAIAFFCFHLYLLSELFLSRKALDGNLRSLALVIASGLFLGLASIGRQHYIILLAAAPLLIWDRRYPRWLFFAYLAAAVIIPMPVFLTWGALVAPKASFAGSGQILISHGLRSFGYGAFIYSIYNVSWLLHKKTLRIFAAASAACVGLSAACGVMGSGTPLMHNAEELLSPGLLFWYSRISLGLFGALGICFALYIVKRLFQSADAFRRYLAASLLLLLAAPAMTTHMFGGRYVSIAVPLLLLLAETGKDAAEDSYWKAGRMAAACALGFISLLACYTAA